LGAGPLVNNAVESKIDPALSTEGKRQKIQDRRRRPTPFLSRYTFWGRRRGSRRGSDAQANYYVDRVSGKYWLVVWAVIALSVSDSLFTLHHLKFGFKEINPILNQFLFSNTSFLVAKYVLTAIGIVALVLHKHFTYIRPVIALVITLYLALNVYQLYLFLNLPR
jgi:hypothetical protein